MQYSILYTIDSISIMSRRKFKLEYSPIIIGDHAMELHKISHVTGVNNSAETQLILANDATNSSSPNIAARNASSGISTLSAPLYLMVSTSDYESAREHFRSSETITPWFRSVYDDKGIHYFANWYSFNYDSLIHTAVKIRSKLVVDKQSLLVMMSLPAFDKKNKIARTLTKKYLQNAINIANSYIE